MILWIESREGSSVNHDIYMCIYNGFLVKIESLNCNIVKGLVCYFKIFWDQYCGCLKTCIRSCSVFITAVEMYKLGSSNYFELYFVCV